MVDFATEVGLNVAVLRRLCTGMNFNRNLRTFVFAVVLLPAFSILAVLADDQHRIPTVTIVGCNYVAMLAACLLQAHTDGRDRKRDSVNRAATSAAAIGVTTATIAAFGPAAVLAALLVGGVVVATVRAPRLS